MQKNYCQTQCKKYNPDTERCQYTTADQCYYLRVDLNRIEKPRRKQRIEVLYASDMEKTEYMVYTNYTYSTFEEE